jgi:hypothetical protein
MLESKRWALLLCAVLPWAASAFQIGPLGTDHEARLTNEKEWVLDGVANKLGVLIKVPVHEEITHLGRGCEAVLGSLQSDTFCSGRNVGVASPFVIYGVRWNDLPPFKLEADQGNCSYLGVNTCRTDQTIRFATQPVCWYCLFADAKKKAAKYRITGCDRSKGTLHGNVMTRSHFGDLQFLHAMASEEHTDPAVTREKILNWTEFAWKVSSKEIEHNTFLNTIDIPAIKEHFGCSGWRVSDLYLLGRQDGKTGLIQQIRDIAFGSVLHTVQDSFAVAHATREKGRSSDMCFGTRYAQPPRVLEFHTYAAQDGDRHDEGDTRDAMAAGVTRDRWPEAVEVTSNLFDLQREGARWAQAKSYLECVFALGSGARPSSPGDGFRRESAR